MIIDLNLFHWLVESSPQWSETSYNKTICQCAYFIVCKPSSPQLSNVYAAGSRVRIPIRCQAKTH